MSKSQIQQIVVIVLLILFGVFWTLMRKTPSPGPAVSAVLPEAHGGTGPAPASVPAGTGQGPQSPAASLESDPFALPSQLLSRIQEREQTKQRKEEEEKQQREEASRSGSAQASSGLLGQKAAPPPDLKLQALFWGIPNPQAIINRQRVSVGDIVSGAKVTAIAKEGITLLINGQETQLKPDTAMRNTQRETQ